MQRSRDFLVEIARKYYIDELSQQEIAREYSLSRPTVSSILKQCRDEGIVEIKIHDASPFSTELGERLKARYNLATVIIVPSAPDQSAVLNLAGAEAAAYAESVIKDGTRVGIAWGTTLYQMVHQMKQLNVVDTSVVQLMGGFGSENPQYDGSDLAREMSKKLNARYFPLQCPVIVQKPELKQMLLTEPGIKASLDHTEKLDIAFVGLSSNDIDKSALVRAGFISRAEASEMLEAGAVGHLCGYSYNSRGELLDISFNQRIIGIDFNRFRNIPERVGIACSAGKAEAVKAALEAGLLTVLITDEAAALRILG